MSKTNSLRQYGYPSGKQINRQASQLANASLPSKRAVSHPFQVQMRDVSGLTDALRALVESAQGGVHTAYGQAQQQQAAIDAAAQQRLGQLDPAYAGATQAAQGGVGDSASSRLLASGAAAETAAGQLPGIVGSRGALQQAALGNALTDALSQRADAYRGAFTQARQQIVQNAQSQAMAMANLDLSQQQLELQRRSLSQSASQATADRRERRWEFVQSSIGQYGYDPRTGQFTNSSEGQNTITAIAAKYKLSSQQVIDMQSNAVQQMTTAIAHGITWKQAVTLAASRGVVPEVIHLALQGVAASQQPYGSIIAKPTPKDYTTNGVTDTPSLQRAVKDWTTAQQNYNKRMSDLIGFFESKQFDAWLRQLDATTGGGGGTVKGPRRSSAVGTGTNYDYNPPYQAPTFPGLG